MKCQHCVLEGVRFVSKLYYLRYSVVLVVLFRLTSWIWSYLWCSKYWVKKGTLKIWFHLAVRKIEETMSAFLFIRIYFLRVFSPRWLLVIAAELHWKELHFFLPLQKWEALRFIVKDRTIISIRLHCVGQSSFHCAHEVLVSTLKPIQSSFNGQSHKL